MLFFIFFWLFLIFLCLEIFLAGAILFISVAFGFLSIALVTMIFTPALPILLTIWVISSLLSSLIIKKATKKARLSRSDDEFAETNVSAMVDQNCTITKKLAQNQYVVLFRFEEWPATPKNTLEEFEIGNIVKIINIVGNRVIIKHK